MQPVHCRLLSSFRPRTALIVSLCAACVVACGSPSSSPVAPATEPGAMAISGSERLAWVQRADSVGQANAYAYGLYVDGNRALLSSPVCVAGGTSGFYECSAALPRLTAGQHVLELVAIDASGAEGPRSAPLVVIISNP